MAGCPFDVGPRGDYSISIPLLIETLHEQLRDEETARLTIRKMIDEKRLESDVLDYKGADQISDRDRKTHWSKALSGFANTGGGVVVWGVDCRKELDTESGLMLDRPTGKPALALNAVEFAQKLADLLANATADVVEGVKIIPVQQNGPAGYVVCLIPEGRNKPYRAMFADERYFMRGLKGGHCCLEGGRGTQLGRSSFFENEL